MCYYLWEYYTISNLKWELLIMDNVEISIIVTVYNRENTISRALQSIEEQTFKDFEVIIVDDESTDNSSRICQNFCAKKLNWKFFKLKHVGVAKAREYAIQNASGKYIAFLDSDDFFEKNFLEVSMNNINDSDILICNYKLFYNKFKANNIFFHQSGTFNKSYILRKIVSDLSIKSFLWNKIFKRKLFDNIFIPDVSCYEDKIICIQLFSKIKKCSIIKNKLYNYHKNPKSITWKTTEEIVSDSIKVSEFIKNFFQPQDYNIIKKSHMIFCTVIFLMIIKMSFIKLIKEKSISESFKYLLIQTKKLKESTKSEKKAYSDIFKI